jgi:hypothetical protein
MRGFSCPWVVLLALAACQRMAAPPSRPAPPPPPPVPDAAPALDAALGLAGVHRGNQRFNGLGELPTHQWEGPPLRRGIVELPPLPQEPRESPTHVFIREIRARAGTIRACYERSLRTAPDLAGEMTLTLSVGRDGLVQKAESPRTAVADEVAGCLLPVARRWHFPPTPEAYTRSVTVKLRPAPQ